LHILRLECLEARRVRRLGGKSEDRDPTVVKYRNEIAHGGNIMCDIDCIRRLEGEDYKHVSAYKEDFGVFYKIPYEKALRKLQRPHTKLIRTFNIACSIQELRVWQKPNAEKTRTTIATNANTIIGAFFETENLDELALRFEENGDLAGPYDKMDTEFRTLSPSIG
jgi:hypothetical protein